MNIKKIAAITFASFSLVGLTHAAKPGFYLGAGAGYSSLESFTDASKISNNNLGGVIFAGYNVSQYLGVEASYRIYGRTEYEIDQYNNLTYDYKLRAFSLVGKAYLPITDDSPFNLYMLMGLAAVQGEGDIELDSYKLGSSSNSAVVATIGIGASYDINSKLTTSLEYSRTGGKDGNNNHIGIPQSNLTTLNVSYNFG